jgi:hypothetical protein
LHVKHFFPFLKHGHFDFRVLVVSLQDTGELRQEHSTFIALSTTGTLLHRGLPQPLHLQIREQETLAVKQGHRELLHDVLVSSSLRFLPQLHPFSLGFPLTLLDIS